MTEEQSDIEMAIASSCNAYFAHRAYMQPTPAFLQLFSDAFQLGADYAMEAAPQPNASKDQS